MSVRQFNLDLAKFSKKTQLNLDIVARKVGFEIWNGVTKKTPVDTGRLRAAWQTKIPLQSASRNRDSFVGLITNNVVYAEPVCFGVNLPPSWGDVYRTRQNTVAGFPELIGKELESYILRQFGR